MDVQLARTKPAAFEEKPPLLDEKQSSVLFWTLSGSESEEQVSVVRKIENRRFVKGIGVYTMPTPGEFTVVYEFMPVSLAEIAASRKVRGPELAYILKQVRASMAPPIHTHSCLHGRFWMVFCTLRNTT
jgi:hypothetical protein